MYVRLLCLHYTISYDFCVCYYLLVIGIVADGNAYDQSKRLRTGGDYSYTGYASPSPFHSPPPPVWGPHGYGFN